MFLAVNADGRDDKFDDKPPMEIGIGDQIEIDITLLKPENEISKIKDAQQINLSATILTMNDSNPSFNDLQ